MVPQHPLGYFPGTEFGKGEIPQNATLSQSVSTNDRNHGVLERATRQITPNQLQVFSNAEQPSTTQPFQKPTTYASQNLGFKTEGELLRPISLARYPPEYQTSTRYRMTEGMLDQQGYPQEKYEKDQYLSSTVSHHQISTSPRRVGTVSSEQLTIPSLRGMESSFTVFSKSRSSTDLLHDQNSSYAAAESEKRQRSISAQPSRSEMKIISGRRQSEILNVKRPSFQMIQQKFHEPLQHL